MNRLIPLLALGVASCSLTPAEQTTVATSITALASVAAAHNTTAAQWLAEGALICGKINSVSGQLVEGSAIIVANAAGIPVSVTGQVAADVQKACPVGLNPGVLPTGANTSVVPVVPTAATLPPVA